MKINVAFWDRTLRFIIGTLMLAWFFAGGSWWGIGGLYLLITSGWGWCALYAILKIQSFNPPSVRIDS